MYKKGHRIERVNDLIQAALSSIIQLKEQDLALGMITITTVRTSQDFSFAKVFVSVLNEKEAKKTIQILNKAAKQLRHELAHAIKLRIVPDLKFVYDDSILRGNRISSLIHKALKDTE